MTLLKVLGFGLVVLLSYTMFANILPQVQSDPPTEEVVELGTMDMAGMIGWGERLFSGKGTCTLCHNDLGRAPNLLKMELATVLPGRIAVDGYAGAAKDAQGAKAVEIYLRESMIAPSVYVVPGFGKKGTDDKVSPMPKVSAAPIELSPPEMNALIAFLQDRAGFDPTVPLPEDVAAVDVGDDDDDEEEIATTAIDAINKFACSACHDLDGSEADGGPKLDGLGKRMDRAAIRRAILDPNATLAEGFEADIMPADFGEQMRVSELELLVDYLSALPE